MAEPTLSLIQSRSEHDRSVYDDGNLRLEHDNYYVACRGEPICLSRKEFLILSRLVRSADRVVTFEELRRHAWRDETTSNSASLRVHICRLRQSLAPYGVSIDSMVGVGYRLAVARPEGSQP
jgi:DNA-binding response OmpR family regulator